jgi:outer membrane murein-binding lipoprotein Lpp
MKRAYSTVISGIPLQGVDMASLFVTWPKALSIASFSVVVATGINAVMWSVLSAEVYKVKTDVDDLRSDVKELRAEVKADIKELREDMREIRVMLSRRWF